MTEVKPSGIKSSKIVDSGRAREILERFVDDKGARVLDVGCGIGSFLQGLKIRGYRNISGVEAVSYPELKEFPVTFAELGAGRLPLADAAYDAVTAWEVVEHLENPYAVFRDIHRILKPGGVFIFSMPNALHWSNKLYFLFTGNFLRWTRKNDHRTIFLPHILQKTCKPLFDAEATVYACGEFWQGKTQYFFRRAHRLFKGVDALLERRLNAYAPENRMFAHFVVYVLKKI